jgi:hypothetical protein
VRPTGGAQVPLKSVPPSVRPTEPCRPDLATLPKRPVEPAAPCGASSHGPLPVSRAQPCHHTVAPRAGVLPTQEWLGFAAVVPIVRALQPACPAPSDAAPHLTSLFAALSALRQALQEAGGPVDLAPWVAALAEHGCLQRLMAPGTRAAHEDAVGVLEAMVDNVCAAVAPGRDGAELASLYGYTPELDEGVNALRVAAVARFIRAHERPQAADIRRPPPEGV